MTTIHVFFFFNKKKKKSKFIKYHHVMALRAHMVTELEWLRDK